MAVFNRSNNSSELPESQIEYRNEDGGRRWVTLIIYIVMALVVATLVVFAGRWVYHKVSNNSGPAPTTITPEETSKSTTTTPSPTTKTPSTSTTPAPTPTPIPSPTKKPSTTTTPITPPATPPSSLPNNGPGEVIALFVGTTLAASGLHYIVSIRRQNT